MTSLPLLTKKAFHTGNRTASKKRCTQSGRLHTHCLACTQSEDHSHDTALPALTSSADCSPLPIFCRPCMDLENLPPEGDFTPFGNREQEEGNKKGKRSRRIDCLWLFSFLSPADEAKDKETNQQADTFLQGDFWMVML